VAEERTCRIVPAGQTYEGKQGLAYFAGVSAQNAGAEHFCLHVLVIPPSGRAIAHLHQSHESAIYLIEGEADVWWGDGLAEHAVMRAGDFMYIPQASRTCPPIAVPSTTSGRWSPGPTQMSRKASCSCRTSSRRRTRGSRPGRRCTASGPAASGLRSEGPPALGPEVGFGRTAAHGHLASRRTGSGRRSCPHHTSP
jgi:uncharacterized RmlC-like cupin family protein